MAEDRECWPGTGTNKNNCLLKDNVQLLTISQADCLKNDILENMKDSFFLSGKRSELCHCFGSNSVVSLDVHALDVHCDEKSAENVKFSQICEENEENCRKKRCTDRYDSSESSDSGVAALSSSSTSDITDPGSPFSTASTHSSNSESGDEKPPTYQSAFPSGSDVNRTADLSADLPADLPVVGCSSKTTRYIDLLNNVPSACFVGKPRNSNPENVDGRNFISLRDSDTLLRIAQSSIGASKTRNVAWNASAPKTARSLASSDGSVSAVASNAEADGEPLGEDMPPASKVSSLTKSFAPTSIQTRRNSATQVLNSLSNSLKNTGSSVGCDGSSSAIQSVELTHRSGQEEPSTPVSSACQVRSKSLMTVSRSLPARPADFKSCATTEKLQLFDSSSKTSSPIWNRTEGGSNLVPISCEAPSLTTIALPTYCFLSSKLAQSRAGKVTKTLPAECFQPLILPAPKSFQWPLTLKLPSIASCSATASEADLPSKLSPTSLGGDAVSPLLLPPAPPSRVSPRVNMVPDGAVLSEEPLPSSDWSSTRGKATPKRNAIAKPIPSAIGPNKRLKYHLTQTKLVQESKVNKTNRNTYVTRQQAQRRCTDLPILPSHAFIAKETEMSTTKTPHQGKITEYFKTQRKPVSHTKKDLPIDEASLDTKTSKTKKNMLNDIPGEEETGLNKYFSLIAQPSKMTKKVHAAANKNVSITSPVQVFLLNKLESDSRVAKILNNYKPQNCLATSPRKTPTSTQKVAERSNGLHPPSKPIFLIPDSQKLQKKFSPSPKKGALAIKSGQQCKLTQSNSNNNLCSATADVPTLNTFSGGPSDMDNHTDCYGSVAEMDSSNCNSEEQMDIVMECSNLVVHESSSVLSESGESSNLSVVVSTSSTASFPMISPILSAPKTIRFPATQRKSLLGSQHDNDDKTQCRWAECSESFHSSTGLMEHLQTKHVIPQTSGEHYVCLWLGCKVFSRKSCSQSWLERHALSHGGNKPFRCIVDGCGQRFGSNTALERHVNGHFDQEGGGSNAQGPRRSLDGVSGKMMRRNGKKLRYRKQPWSARMFDYFDSGIMEGLQHRLVGMTQARTSGLESTPGNTMVLTSKVMARRIAPDGTTRYLLKWFPADVLDDEWVPQSQVVSTRSVPIPLLPASAAAPLHSALLAAQDPPRNKHRRKPVCQRKT